MNIHIFTQYTNAMTVNTVRTNLDERIEHEYKKRSKGHNKTRKFKVEILSELSELLGVGKEHLYKIRKNEYGLSLANAVKVAEYFDCSVDDLIIKDKAQKQLAAA